MTLLEKIKNYKWFDSPNKLRTILEELYNSIGGGSGGGTQDLQSVLDNGNNAIGKTLSIGDINSSYSLLEDTTVSANNELTQEYCQFSPDGMSISNFINQEQCNVYLDFIIYRKQDESKSNTLHIKRETDGQAVYKFSEKPTGTHTLATLEDIKKIDLTGRIYANNAAAISGGLTANDVYRTSTGELRIVV